VHFLLLLLLLVKSLSYNANIIEYQNYLLIIRIITHIMFLNCIFNNHFQAKNNIKTYKLPTIPILYIGLVYII
jgi:hypothetical protein